jgi:heme-degrading monooxygenase HmoA
VTRSQTRLRAKRGRRGEPLRELERLEILAAIGEEPGFLGAALLVPEADSEGVLLEGLWASLEHYERWRASPAASELERGLRPRASPAASELERGLRHLLSSQPEVAVYQVVEAIG